MTGRAQIWDGTEWVSMTGSGSASNGGLLTSGYGITSVVPTGGLLHRLTLTIASLVPVVVDAGAMLRADNVDEGERFDIWLVVDGLAFPRAVGNASGVVSQGSHTHNTQGSTVTGTASSHQHTIAVGSHNHGSRSTTISVTDVEASAACIALRKFTPSGLTFDVELHGSIVNGSPANFDGAVKAMVFEA